MSTEDTLGGDTANSHHSKPSVQQFAHLTSFAAGLGIKAEITGLPLSLHGSLHGGDAYNQVPKTDPEEELVHGSLEESVVGVDDLGNGLEAVRLAGDADEFGDDESHDGKHGGAAVTDLGLAEEGQEGGVCFGEAKGIEFVFSSLEVLGSDAVYFVHS